MPQEGQEETWTPNLGHGSAQLPEQPQQMMGYYPPQSDPYSHPPLIHPAQPYPQPAGYALQGGDFAGWQPGIQSFEPNTQQFQLQANTDFPGQSFYEVYSSVGEVDNSLASLQQAQSLVG